MTITFKPQKLLYLLGILALVWIIVAFVYFPIISVLMKALVADGTPTSEAISDLARSRRVRSVVWNTIWISVLSVFTVNVVGIFQVAVLEYVKVRGNAILRVGYATPLVLVSVVAAAGYKFTYGEFGVVTRALQPIFPDLDPEWFTGGFAVLYAHTFLLTYFHFLFLRAAMRKVDFSTIEAARNLGASQFTAFIRIALPVLLPTLFATSILVFYYSISSFALPLILGGEDFSMVAELILNLNSFRRQDLAAMLALGMGVIIVICFLAIQYFESRSSYVGGAKTPVRIQKTAIQSPVINAVVHFFAYLLFVVNILPALLIVMFSFATTRSIVTDVIPTELTLRNYVHVFSNSNAVQPFINSVLMGLAAVSIGLAVSLFAVPLIHKYRNIGTKLLDLSFLIPWILPYALLAIGLIIAYDSPNWMVFGKVLLGTFWILPIAYALVQIPLMVRFLRAAFWNLDPAYGEAARSLGSSPLYAFRRITLPLILPVVVLTGAMAFNRIISEYTLSAFLYNVNNRPLSIALVDGARDPNPEQTAINLVYITLIMIFSFVVVTLADRFGLGSGKADH